MAESSQSSTVALPRRTVSSAKPLTKPGFSGQPGSQIPDSETNYLNTSIKALRSVDPITAIRALTRYNGTFSAAVYNYIELAMSGYSVTAYKVGTNQFDPEGTSAAISQMASLATLYDYTSGYADRPSLDTLLTTLLKEVMQTGACSVELVLNRFRLPERMIPIPITDLRWLINSDETGKYPEQQVPSGDPVPLDIPTFFYASLQQQSNSQFSRSPLEAALQTIFVYGDFLESIWRVIRKSGHSRITAQIIEEKAKASAPPDVLADPKKMEAYLEKLRETIENVLSGTSPEDALVYFDSVDMQLMSAKGEKSDYTGLLDSYSGQLATSLKSMPSVLGVRLQGSQSLSNTESLIFIKNVAGIRTPVETVMSRALTLSTRLYAGTDSYVKFRFNPIELRPEAELSAHRSVDQQRVMRLLSIGMLSDEEAAHQLGTFPLPDGYQNLSGTFFMDAASDEAKPKDVDNTGGQQRVLGEGTKSGSPNSSGGGDN